MKKLSPKRRKFVAEYLKDQNASQAAIRAGYSKKTAQSQGARLLTKVQVKEAVDCALKEASERAIVDVTYVLTGLKEVGERCMQRVPVMIRDPKDGRKFIQKTEEDEHGVEQGVWEFDSMGANKSLELLGKNLKMFTDRVEHDVADDMADRLCKARERAKRRG